MDGQGRPCNTVVALRALFVCVVLLLLSCSCNKKRIEIVSYLVRDRAIPLDNIVMRSTIIVAFRLTPTSVTPAQRVVGNLYHNSQLIASDTIAHLDSLFGNLGFDVSITTGDFDREKPYGIPDGTYTVAITAYDPEGRVVARTEKRLHRNELSRTFRDPDKGPDPVSYVLSREEGIYGRTGTAAVNTRQVEKRGYHIFQKGLMERVYERTEPHPSEMVNELSTEIAKGESRALTFSIRAEDDLGMVGVTAGPFKTAKGNIRGMTMTMGAVTQLTEITGTGKGSAVAYYRRAPRIIEAGPVNVSKGQTQTFWVTVKTDDTTRHGDYETVIRIRPERGNGAIIPFHIRVLPFKLHDTDIEYGMMMDYAFYELDNQVWGGQERGLIERSGESIYRDLREHGMTMVYPHSHFYYMADERGEPVLDSLRAALKSYVRNGFPGPFVWYIGHMLQTAKSKHPGSILIYDGEVAERRLTDLLKRYELLGKEYGIPKESLIVQVVDEPDSDQKERVRAGKQLHQIARKMGFRTLITRSWPDVDVVCEDSEEAERLHRGGMKWWIYPNRALTAKNLAFTRYTFGFGAWKRGVDGVIPWTFQMSEGSNGNPFTVLDGSEIMVAYPGVAGPITTPTWEVIREGINDYKYIYLLEQEIEQGKRRGVPTARRVEEHLKALKENLGRPPEANEGVYGDWSPERFTVIRKQLAEWVLELSEHRGRPKTL